MSRIFTIRGENLSLGTGNVLAAFRTAADAVTAGGEIAIRRVEISQNGSATLAMIRGAISTRDTAGTLTCSSHTPAPISPTGGPACALSGNTAPAGGAARVGINSSADSGGTYNDLLPFNFANVNGWLYIPTPEDRIVIAPATVCALRLLAAPGTTTGWTFSMVIEELT